MAARFLEPDQLSCPRQANQIRAVTPSQGTLRRLRFLEQIQQIRPRRRYYSKDVRLAGERGRSFRAAVRRVGQPRSRSDGERFKGGKERHEAQRSDAEREDTQNFFHIGSYACSI